MNTLRAIGLGELAAEAAKKGFIELGNATGSGLVVKVTKVVANTADTDINLIFHTATQASSGAAETKANKIAGGTAPTSSLKTEAAATISGTVIATKKASANAEIEFDFSDGPLILYSGAYFIVANNAVNLILNSVIIEWHEIDESY